MQEIIDTINEIANDIAKRSRSMNFLIIRNPVIIDMINDNNEFNKEYLNAFKDVIDLPYKCSFTKEHVDTQWNVTRYCLTLKHDKKFIELVLYSDALNDMYKGYCRGDSLVKDGYLPDEIANTVIATVEDKIGITINEFTYGIMDYRTAD